MNTPLRICLIIGPLLTLFACKGKDKAPPACKTPAPAKKTVTVPKFFTSRTILEFQIHLARSIKIKAWKDLETWLLGGLIKDTCPTKALGFDWEGCFKGVDTQALELKSKKLPNCPSGTTPAFSSEKCPVTSYCEKLSLLMENKAGQKREVTFTGLAKVAEKWWVMGPISCKNVP
ncbi:hypothetical protein KKF84_11030 [Myxococcota bacterium]|nr:hypothetical protein [Myxococcota bacterium]MBU1535844.1 hypothetical protein [Myxococcota bacterium]